MSHPKRISDHALYVAYPLRCAKRARWHGLWASDDANMPVRCVHTLRHTCIVSAVLNETRAFEPVVLGNDASRRIPSNIVHVHLA